ncbi:uncharacterized protein LOC18448397 [Amborella trichopoda]|uniref:Protein MAINTENANCE OF PSII UNDER HIGH LIGHT 1 n=1 Tax=Amborella trichopoda TaxID=13333 RepID=U5DHK9_AMBTC|nr:uncharacterized protein LOC18448397 [Amborella trichopoda]ERN19988.1 hypothetical protein AMTR_s00071p00149740 [Amborella trichopoda]|eukprot:XP_006858521.1 uncharacterized protein LOC18448397 [Amborella trichopoda]
MAASAQSLFSANFHVFSNNGIIQKFQKVRKNGGNFVVKVSSDSADDCNVEECAPDKEVGKVSMEWLAVEKTRVVGTYPPKKKGWTGYVEKDTAGQKNIYSVEPTVYIAESAISSGSAGTSSEGADNTVRIAAGLGLLSLAAASSILLQVGKTTPPQIQTLEYSGPSLSYYINKFKPPEVVQASVPSETPTITLPESLPEASPETIQAQVVPSTGMKTPSSIVN